MHPSTRFCYSCLPGRILFLGAAIHLLVVVDAQQQQNTSRQQTRQNGIEDPNQGEDPCQVLAEVISDLDFLSYTQSAVQAAGLLTSFRSRSIGVTFLAPTNQGFARAAQQLGFESVRDLLINRAVVRRIIEQHLLPYVITIDELEAGQTLRTMDFGSPLTVQMGTDKKALEFAGSGGISTQLRVILDYQICKASVILVDNALIPADVFAMRELESNLPDPSPRTSTNSLPQTGGSMSTGKQANVGSRPNDASGIDGDSLNDENNDYEIDEPNALPAAIRQFETDSISLEYPDYDFEDFIVDFPRDGPRQVPTVGVRVPPLPQRRP